MVIPPKNMTNRQKNALITRKKIVDAALSLLSEKDIISVKIEEITNLAGTSKGSFYSFFENKSDLLREYYYRVDQIYQRIYDALDPQLNASGKLMRFALEAIMVMTKGVGSLINKSIFEAQLIYDRFTYVTSPKRNFYRIYINIVAEGQQTGEFRTDLTEYELGNFIVLNTRGLHYSWSLFESKGIAFNLAKETINLFFELFTKVVAVSPSSFPLKEDWYMYFQQLDQNNPAQYRP